jgi:hypothetical protein
VKISPTPNTAATASQTQRHHSLSIPSPLSVW